MADQPDVSDEIPESDRINPPLPVSGNPVSEPADIPAADQGLDDTHPATDTGLQAEEEYDEGLSGAAEAEEPKPDNAVGDYNPKEGQDQPS